MVEGNLMDDDAGLGMAVLVTGISESKGNPLEIHGESNGWSKVGLGMLARLRLVRRLG